MGDPVLRTEIGTFIGVPASRELRDSKAAVLGIPFDCGVHPTRIGARLGPRSIREHSGLVRRYEPSFHDYDPVARLALLDGLAGLDRVTFDVNTLSLPHDSAGTTAFLAGTVMHKCLQLACAALERRPSAPPL